MRIEISGPLIAASRNDKGSFVRALDAEIDGMVNDFRRDIQRAVYMDGSGKLAKVTGANTGTTIPVDRIRFCDIDAPVDIYRNGSPVSGATGLVIASASKTNSTVTVASGTFTTAAGDIIVRSGSYDKDLHGLEVIVSDTGTLQGIDSSQDVNAFWRSTVLANGGTNRALTETLMQTAYDAAEDVDGQVSLMLCGFGVRRAYLNLLTSLKRFSNTLELEGGWKALEESSALAA